MKNLNRVRPLFALLTLFAAVSVARAIQTGVVVITTPTVTTAHQLQVPDGSASYSIEVYDHNGWWWPDTHLSSVPTQNLPTNDAGDPIVNLNVQTVLLCQNGYVAGSLENSGEVEAEIYLVVTWYDSKGNEVTSSESSINSVSCAK